MPSPRTSGIRRVHRPRPIFLLCGMIILIILSLSINSANAQQARGRASAKKKPGVTVGDGSPDDLAEQLTVAGQMMPIARKFAITGDKGHAIFEALKEAIDMKEFFILGIVGWGSIPFTRTVHDVWVNVTRQPTVGDEGDVVQDAGTAAVPSPDQFTDTYLYHLVEDISQVAKIGALVYAVDCLSVVLNTIGFRQRRVGLSKKVAKISYTIWGARRVSRLKHFLLNRALKNKPNAVGRTRLYNRMLNVVLSIVTGAMVFDVLDIDFGLAIKSLLSFGGVGALILSLSSKDLASELVSGVAVSTSDQFFEGDEIQLGDGTAGFIERMGLAYTDIRGYDEINTRIPNSQLSGQRVKNLSRVTLSQVKQTLWFSYKDVAKMPEVTEAIKAEVEASCPEAITDGSRPFRAHWRDYKDDHLEVVVDFHFNISASSGAYWDNKQKVLEAIARAVERIGVDFTLPSMICSQQEA